MARVLERADELVDRRIEEMMMATVSSGRSSFEGPDDILGTILRSGEVDRSLTVALVRDLIVAGADTTAAAVTMTLFEVLLKAGGEEEHEPLRDLRLVLLVVEREARERVGRVRERQAGAIVKVEERDW